jgi:hypothetical protein
MGRLVGFPLAAFAAINVSTTIAPTAATSMVDVDTMNTAIQAQLTVYIHSPDPVTVEDTLLYRGCRPAGIEVLLATMSDEHCGQYPNPTQVLNRRPKRWANSSGETVAERLNLGLRTSLALVKRLVSDGPPR